MNGSQGERRATTQVSELYTAQRDDTRVGGRGGAHILLEFGVVRL